MGVKIDNFPTGEVGIEKYVLNLQANETNNTKIQISNTASHMT